MRRTIRFLAPWRGRMPGETNRELDDGVMAELVRRHVAEWVDEKAAAPPRAATSDRREGRRRA